MSQAKHSHVSERAALMIASPLDYGHREVASSAKYQSSAVYYMADTQLLHFPEPRAINNYPSHFPTALQTYRIVLTLSTDSSSMLTLFSPQPWQVPSPRTCV
jgi:hypothetical protein